MDKKMHNLWKLVLALVGTLIFVSSVDAQPFVYNSGDLMLGFRKTGTNQGSYEAVVDIGAPTNYVYLTAGTTVNIRQYTNTTQLANTFGTNYQYLSWSVCGWAPSSAIFSNYWINTLWVTVPRVGGVQSPAANRSSQSDQQQTRTPINGIGNGARILSPMTAVGIYNTATFLQESYASAQGLDYSAQVADPTYSNIGDLQASPLFDVNGSQINIENTTPSPFTTAVQSDLYQLVPTGHTDPNNLLTTGTGYYVGYFQFNTDGTMTFTRASTVTAPPVAGFTASPTNGTAPLAVTFTDASSGSITNWLWSFGDGFSVTNTSNASVGHTYTNSGTYSASLKVTGPGGNNTLATNIFVISAPVSNPRFNSVSLIGGKLIVSGTNGTASTQYRVLLSTNLSSTNWVAVYTNQFTGTGTFAYTNSSPSKPAAFFKLISP